MNDGDLRVAAIRCKANVFLRDAHGLLLFLGVGLGADPDDDGLDAGSAAPPLLGVAAIAIELGSLQDRSSTCSVEAVEWDAPTAGNEADSIGDLLLIKEDDGEVWLNQIVSVVQLRQEDFCSLPPRPRD